MLLASFVFLLVIEAASLLWVTPQVLREVNGYDDPSGFFVIAPFPIKVMDVTGMMPVYLFIFFAGSIMASLLWFFKDAKVVARGAQRAVADKMDAPDRSQLGLTFQIFVILVLASVAWYVLIQGAGVTPNTPDFGSEPVWQQAYGFAKASVYEELISRVLFIGIPMMLVAATRHRKGWWKLLGGAKGDLEYMDWALVAISGAIFAVAHAPDWDWYKVPPTVIAGLGFGYLFAKKGLGSAIMLHFAVDYMGMPEIVFNLKGIGSAIAILELVFLAMGVYVAMRYMLAVGEVAGHPELAAAPSPTTIVPEGRFVCMVCGGMDARYSEGTLQCLNCGQIYKFL